MPPDAPRATDPVEPVFPAAAVVVMIVAAVARIATMVSQSLSIDEIAELRIASLGVDEIVGVGDGFPPLFHLVAHPFVGLGGTDIWVRGLALVAGLLSVWLVMQLADRVRPGAGPWAGIVLALSPLHVQLTSEGRAYSFLVFLTALFLWAAYDAVVSDRTIAWVRAAASGGALLYAHYYGAICILLVGVAYLVYRRGRPTKRAYFGAIGLVMLGLPVLAIFSNDLTLQAQLSSGRTIIDAVLVGAVSLISGTGLGLSTRDLHTATVAEGVAAIAMWLPFLVAIVFLAWTAIARRRLLFVWIVAGGFVATVIIGDGAGVGFNPRYVGWLTVPLAVVLGVAIVRSAPLGRNLLVGALLIVSVASIASRMFIDSHRNEDARAVAAYLESDEVDPATPVFAAHWILARPVSYYLDRDTTVGSLGLPEDASKPGFEVSLTEDLQIGVLPPVTSLDDREAWDFIDTALVPGAPYLLLYGREFQADPDGLLLDELARRGPLDEVTSFAGITVYEGRIDG